MEITLTEHVLTLLLHDSMILPTMKLKTKLADYGIVSHITINGILVHYIAGNVRKFYIHYMNGFREHMVDILNDLIKLKSAWLNELMRILAEFLIDLFRIF